MGGGSRPLPTALKQLKGTHQSCRDADNAPAPNIPRFLPSPPEYLNYRAAEIFRELCVHLTQMKILNVEDVPMLSLLSSRLQEVEEHTETIESEGYSYLNDKGMWKSRPEVAMRNEAMRHAQSLLIEFGLSPAARSRVSAAIGDKPDNPFKMLDQ
ncbi:phage terminase small subunit P27 family [Rhizobium leguminosarum]|uniref:phage terminase small subunit P27 family n=1 Tax=Rhizobium leguminosarum TaxID=384 RepID=UPI0014425732|nr:phage terminase small subunit P27 family [Rhizobium leguminosarum]MBY5863253.1 phage terminase small subunit P27 family [Rhizobium leguminosarum]NKM04132.1 phage terminase small subunit P27 family [Rhizobium leguminosarum bv. viciae]